MRLGALLISLLVVSGCFRVDTYYAEGVSLATRDRDLAQCELAATRDYPVRESIRQRPRVFHPGRQVCNADGNCYYRPGHWSGGEIYTVDLNRDARARAVTGCMGGAGYTLVNLPNCTLDGPIAVSTVMPRLTGETCVIQRGASQLIVSP